MVHFPSVVPVAWLVANVGANHDATLKCVCV